MFFSIFQSLNFFHDLGISVSHASLQRKMKELGKQQEHRFQSQLSTCIEEVKCPQSVEKAAEEQTATKTDKRFRPMELLVNNFGKNILQLITYSFSIQYFTSFNFFFSLRYVLEQIELFIIYGMMYMYILI